MRAPAATVREGEIADRISAVQQEFGRDVASIRSDFGTDWSGDNALFFGIVLKDAATRGKRLTETTDRVRNALRAALSPLDLGVILYFSFRGESEQAKLRDQASWFKSTDVPFPDDLLHQADHLARWDRRRPKQASLRRAVSTAYYALFHLLISTAVKHWKIEDQRSMHTTDPGLKAVVRTFADLQQERHRADYDNGKAWTRIEVAAQ